MATAREFKPTPRAELLARLDGMLSNCRAALRIATEMGDQPLVGRLFDQQTKIESLVEAVAP